MKKLLLLSLLVFSQTAAAESVNIYSSRQSQLIKPLLDAFQADTGIRVNLTTATDDVLLKRLENEGQNSPADLLMTADAGRLYRAKSMGLLQPIQSPTLFQAIPAHLRDPQNTWFGLTYRARTIFYAKGRVRPSELSTYEALTDPRWKARICVRSSNSIYNQSLVASMISSVGLEKAQQWANGVVRNFARRPVGGDREQIKDIASGRCDIGIANSYYYAQMLFGGDATERSLANKVGIFWPNQRDRGTHINISGAGVTASAKNKANAEKLLNYLLKDDAQRWYATVNGEYPVKKGIPADPKIQAWGRFKSDSLNLSELGRFNAHAVRVMDKAGWR
ncbi:Fe(3+) ABC transporter substrate-binding protein [Leucothrix sargassi]|nr:Fe(3+) ABC transporter substrate-binding protein [Leucothrix sargassi]